MQWYDSNKIALTFDDVLLRPGYSELNSRSDCNYRRSLWLPTGIEHILSPILIANMKTVATLEMATALNPLDIVVPMHRFQDVHSEARLALQTYLNMPKAASIGLHEPKRTECMAENYDILFLELAHAHHALAVNEIRRIKQAYPKNLLVVGNVATAEACKCLFDAGADMVKVGVGPGSVCTTRLVTGTGVPQLSAVIECAMEGPIIADGGIKTSGDIVKALAAGAEYVMIGGLFAGTDEACGERLSNGHKVYFGMDTREAGKVSHCNVAEGISTSVPYTGSAYKIAEELLGGLRQGMAMVGAKTLTELYQKAVFQRISNHTLLENQPHARIR